MVEVHPAAADEIAEAADRYEGLYAGLGRRFAAAVRSTFDRLEEAPLAGARVRIRRSSVTVRRWPVDKFPYAIMYVTDPRVEVIAVPHDRRRPGYWRDRLAKTR